MSKLFFAFLFCLFYAGFSLEFIQQPKSVSVGVGQQALFSVAVKARGPVEYSWYINGKLIAKTQEANFTTSALKTEDDKSRVVCVAREISISEANFSDDGSGQDELGLESKLSEEAFIRVSKPLSQTVNLTGKLNQPDGYFNVIVHLYSETGSTTPAYSESFLIQDQQGVELEDQKFNVRLGTGKRILEAEQKEIPLAQVVALSKNVFIEFEIGAEGSPLERLSPRIPLTSMPYAQNSHFKGLSGKGQPLETIEAPVGTFYHDVEVPSTGSYVKTSSGWVRL